MQLRPRQPKVFHFRHRPAKQHTHSQTPVKKMLGIYLSRKQLCILHINILIKKLINQTFGPYRDTLLSLVDLENMSLAFV